LNDRIIRQIANAGSGPIKYIPGQEFVAKTASLEHRMQTVRWRTQEAAHGVFNSRYSSKSHRPLLDSEQQRPLHPAIKIDSFAVPGYVA
jgi:hypothetical protein